MLAAPFLVWTATGLLFHIKPGWAEAYETLSIERRDRALPEHPAPPAFPGATRLELFDCALGPVYRVHRGRETALFDARDGRALSPLSPDAARDLAVDAVARSPYRAAYGEPGAATPAGDDVVIAFGRGPKIRVDRRSGQLAREAIDTRRIDALYDLHYLRWTGIPAIDRALAVLAIVATWVLTGLGGALFFRRKTAR